MKAYKEPKPVPENCFGAIGFDGNLPDDMCRKVEEQMNKLWEEVTSKYDKFLEENGLEQTMGMIREKITALLG